MDVVRQQYGTSNPYEEKFGYSRAVRRGPFIFVSGTTSIDPETGEIFHPASAYHQTLRIFAEILRAVEALSGKKEDIVRIRIFVTASEDVRDVGCALKKVFGELRPAATMTIGSKFVDPEMRVEIEADAVVM